MKRYGRRATVYRLLVVGSSKSTAPAGTGPNPDAHAARIPLWPGTGRYFSTRMRITPGVASGSKKGSGDYAPSCPGDVPNDWMVPSLKVAGRPGSSDVGMPDGSFGRRQSAPFTGRILPFVGTQPAMTSHHVPFVQESHLPHARTPNTQRQCVLTAEPCLTSARNMPHLSTTSMSARPQSSRSLDADFNPDEGYGETSQFSENPPPRTSFKTRRLQRQ